MDIIYVETIALKPGIAFISGHEMGVYSSLVKNIGVNRSKTTST